MSDGGWVEATSCPSVGVGLVFSICPVSIDSSSIFSVDVSFLMHFIDFQIADIKDALAGLYGVVPKIQCLLPKVRGAVLASVSSLRRRVPLPGSCVLCGVPGVELHVGTPWAFAVCAYRHVLGMCRACVCVPVCARVCICTRACARHVLCVLE